MNGKKRRKSTVSYHDLSPAYQTGIELLLSGEPMRVVSERSGLSMGQVARLRLQPMVRAMAGVKRRAMLARALTVALEPFGAIVEDSGRFPLKHGAGRS
jgi:hypothetical protein